MSNAPVSPHNVKKISSPDDIKTQLIEKLIEENRALLTELQDVQEQSKSETLRLKRDAARIMDRLVTDNAWYRKEMSTLQKRLESSESLDKKARETILSCRQDKEIAEKEREALAKHVATLREEKVNLEFQTKHLGAAFLTLRESVIEFIGNPTALEAESTETSWEARIESPTFQTAVAETVQQTSKLRTLAEAIDARLVSLKLLDPTASMAVLIKKKSGSLHLMGEKLIPYRELAQLKKERQLWQRRYLKSQEEIVTFKIKEDQLVKNCDNKDALIKKLQAQKSVGRTTETLKGTFRTRIGQLEQELATTREQLRQTQLGLKNSKEEQKTINNLPPMLTPSATRAFLEPVGTPISPTSSSHQGFPIHTMRTLRSPANTRHAEISPSSVSSPTSRRYNAAASRQRSLSPLHSPSLGVRTLSIPEIPSASIQQPFSGGNESLNRQASSSLSPIPSRMSSKRTTITTTIGKSEYQSPLAREIAGLEKAASLEPIDKKLSKADITPLNPSSFSPITIRMASAFLEGQNKEGNHIKLKKASAVTSAVASAVASTVTPSPEEKHAYTLSPAASAAFLEGPAPAFNLPLRQTSDFLTGNLSPISQFKKQTLNAMTPPTLENVSETHIATKKSVMIPPFKPKVLQPTKEGKHSSVAKTKTPLLLKLLQTPSASDATAESPYKSTPSSFSGHSVIQKQREFPKISTHDAHSKPSTEKFLSIISQPNSSVESPSLNNHHSLTPNISEPVSSNISEFSNDTPSFVTSNQQQFKSSGSIPTLADVTTKVAHLLAKTGNGSKERINSDDLKDIVESLK